VAEVIRLDTSADMGFELGHDLVRGERGGQQVDQRVAECSGRCAGETRVGGRDSAVASDRDNDVPVATGAGRASLSGGRHPAASQVFCQPGG